MSKLLYENAEICLNAVLKCCQNAAEMLGSVQMLGNAVSFPNAVKCPNAVEMLLTLNAVMECCD